MKVLLLTTTFSRRPGDQIPLFIDEFSRGLCSEVDFLVICAPHSSGSAFRETINGAVVYRFPYFFPYSAQKLAYGGGITSNLKKSLLARLQLPFFVLAQIIQSLFLAKKEKIELIHSHWLVSSGLAGAICRIFLPVKHVITVHAAGVTMLRQSRLGRVLAEFIISHCDSVTVVSRYMYEQLLECLPRHMHQSLRQKTKIIPMGIDTGHYREIKKGSTALPGDKPDLLFIGRLVEKKGLRYLIEAMPLIIDRFPGAVLNVCGQGPLQEELSALVKEKKLEKQVRFKGHVQGGDKDVLFSTADLVIVPSVKTETGDTEGLPVVVMEALACGLPVAASAAGGIPDAVQDGVNGLLFREKDPFMLAEKVIRILADRVLYEKLSRGARESSAGYDWQNIIRRFKAVYKKLTQTGAENKEVDYDRLHREWDNAHFKVGTPTYRLRKKLVLSLLSEVCGNNSCRNVLDLGCGTGDYSIAMASRGLRVTGVDVSGYAVDKAKAKAAAKKIKNIYFLKNNAADFEPEERFDLILISEVLEHMPDDKGLFLKYSRLLSSEGFILFTVPFDSELWSYEDEQAGHKRRYSKDQARELCSAAGLEPVKIYCYGFPLLRFIWRRKAEKKNKSGTSARGIKIFILLLTRFLSTVIAWVDSFNLRTGKGVGLIVLAQRKEEGS